jgi:predicted nucleotidyltransferase
VATEAGWRFGWISVAIDAARLHSRLGRAIRGLRRSEQSMISPLRFPTELHREVADLARDFFAAHAQVDTILVVNSCARGRAVAGSDLDMAVLIKPTAPSQEVQSLTMKWNQFMATQPMVHRFRSSSRFTQVHVDVFDGRMAPSVWDDGGGPDSFEVEIGNRVAYAAPLEGAGMYFRQLQSQWLPYYGEDLRLSRLAMVREACARDLEAIPFFLGRSLYFQAFDRLYKAFHEFLQALFLARRTYPLAYNKWIREQVTELLSLPGLYEELPPILSVGSIESAELGEKGDALRVLLERWTCLGAQGREAAQPGASPNGGLVQPVGNSEVSKGPPSVT